MVPISSAGKLALVLGTKWERLGVKILVVPITGAGNQLGTGWDQMGTETGVENPVVPITGAGNQMGTFEQVPSTTETSNEHP